LHQVRNVYRTIRFFCVQAHGGTSDLDRQQNNNPNKMSKEMIPEKLKEIMKKDGVVAIATLGEDGPHMVNTWNSYMRVSEDGRLFIPAGYMHKTEKNIAHNPEILITLGSCKVKGLHGPGAGFLIKGKAEFITSGPDPIDVSITQ
jgi:predicted pyridoxine 5'-phosphate oxidase superfamily flavin-nucleotide-binding protein